MLTPCDEHGGVAAFAGTNDWPLGNKRLAIAEMTADELVSALNGEPIYVLPKGGYVVSIKVEQSRVWVKLYAPEFAVVGQGEQIPHVELRRA